MMPARRTIIIIGLIPTLSVTVLPLARWLVTLGIPGPFGGSDVVFWTLTLLVLFYVRRVERRPLSSIGFRGPGAIDLLLGLVAGAIMILGMGLIYAIVFPALHLQLNRAHMDAILHTPVWYRVLLAARAAITEEVLFRGYPIERLQELTGNRYVAAVISVAAFTYAHLSAWGPGQLVVVAFGGVLLAGLYLWRRNIWANILAHGIADGVPFLFGH